MTEESNRGDNTGGCAEKFMTGLAIIRSSNANKTTCNHISLSRSINFLESSSEFYVIPISQYRGGELIISVLLVRKNTIEEIR